MNTAKLIRLELISDPEQAIPDPLSAADTSTSPTTSGRPTRTGSSCSGPSGRCSTATRSTRTVPIKLGPDVWTDAPVEIVDRSNLPRKPGADAAVAPTGERGEPQQRRRRRHPRRPAPAAADRHRRRPADLPRTRGDQTGAKPLPKPQPKNSQAKRGRRLQRRPPGRVAREGADEPVGRGRPGDARRGRGEVRRQPSRRSAAVAVAGGLVPGVHAARESRATCSRSRRAARSPTTPRRTSPGSTCCRRPTRTCPTTSG